MNIIKLAGVNGKTLYGSPEILNKETVYKLVTDNLNKFEVGKIYRDGKRVLFVLEEPTTQDKVCDKCQAPITEDDYYETYHKLYRENRQKRIMRVFGLLLCNKCYDKLRKQPFLDHT